MTSVPAPYGLYPTHTRDLGRVDVVRFEEFSPLGLAVGVEGDWDEVSDDAVVVWQVCPFEVEFEE